MVRMLLLKTAALLALALFIAPALVIALAAKPRDPLQVSSTYQGSDLNTLSAEDINRKTLEAAEAMRATQAERFLQRQH